MSDRFNRGDLALCLTVAYWTAPKTNARRETGPKSGGVYTVSGVTLADCGECLHFDEFPRRRFPADRFRKVTPPAADEFDRETIALLNGKPVREMA